MSRARDIADLISGANGANGFLKLDGSSRLPAVNGSQLTGLQAIETGTILSWSNSTVPSGFLECDGSAVSRTTYADLFAVIASDYGAGDGSSTFNLPNMQDKVQVGVSSGKAVASTGGSENQTPSGSISVNNHTLSTSQMPSHRHTNYRSRYAAGTGWYGTYSSQINPSYNNHTNYQGSTSAHSHGGSFSGSSMSVLQPYVAMKFMIKT